MINNDDTPTVKDEEKILQKKWEEFDEKLMEDAHKKRRKKSTSLQDLIHSSGGRKDDMKSNQNSYEKRKGQFFRRSINSGDQKLKNTGTIIRTLVLTNYLIFNYPITTDTTTTEKIKT